MRNSRLIAHSALTFLLLSLTSCQKPATNPESHAAENPTEPPTLTFDLKSTSPVPASSVGARSYDCSYRAHGKTARFRLQFSYGPFSGDIPMARATGKFVAVTGSENTALLEDLKVTLEGQHTPKNSIRVAELPFDAVVLGENLSRDQDGSLSTQPPGDWTSMKIFLPKGRRRRRVLSACEPRIGQSRIFGQRP